MENKQGNIIFRINLFVAITIKLILAFKLDKCFHYFIEMSKYILYGALNMID